jgi:mono/diheme cytochrome c family protein
MNEQMVSDVMAYMKSFPENTEPPELPANATGQQIFEARCAVCHGPEGQGKEDDGLWYPGMALWQGDVQHLTEEQHRWTIEGGRRFAFMPQFSESPAQGIPVPPFPLTPEQIEAVMDYERSL